MTTRRLFLARLLGSCSRAESGVRLRSRPVERLAGETRVGVIPLEFRKGRESFFTPRSRRGTGLFCVYLHGATGNEQQGVRRLGELAEEFGFLLLSPASQETAWDAIRFGYGPDVRLIDGALDKVFSHRRVNPRKIAICGFRTEVPMRLDSEFRTAICSARSSRFPLVLYPLEWSGRAGRASLSPMGERIRAAHSRIPAAK